jgi:hypothetical protein
VVKQLPVEMFQQISSTSSCVICRHPLSCRSTTPDVSIPHLSFWMALCSFLVFHNTLPTLLRSLVAWIPPSALLSCSSKQLVSARCFSAFLENVCVSTALTALWFQNSNETKVSSCYSHDVI